MYRKLSLALLPVLLLGCGGTEDVPVERSLVEVDTFIVRETVQPILFNLPGYTKAFKEAEVRPQVDGIIMARLFEEGSFVNKGQSLYQIDPAQYKANLMMAKSKVEAERASLEATKAKLDRTKKLVPSGAVSKERLDEDMASYKVSVASLHIAEASLHQAQIDLDYTKVKAPISGIISQSYITDGALVSSGQNQMLAKIQQLDPINVDLRRSTTEVLRLKQASERGELVLDSTPTVSITVGGDTSYRSKAKFTEINVDRDTDSVVLRAEFPNQNRQFLPGMFVHTSLKVGEDPHAILVPQKSVTRNSKGESTIMVIVEESKVERRVVEVAEAVGKKWRVISGLVEGDEIVISNLQRIQSGDRVKVDNRASEATKPTSISSKELAINDQVGEQ